MPARVLPCSAKNTPADVQAFTGANQAGAAQAESDAALQLARRRSPLGALIGPSLAMQAVRERLPRIAAARCSVLITGETGTGKECVARAVHLLGPRATGPFVTINCAALPDSLLDSELFGYERGAFTGAHQAYPGKIALADRGTLLLDEIGDMPLLAQAKLLRVLETHEVFPIGAMRSRSVDVRVVAATHQGLERAVAEGRFRADLFYRLNVARIELTPLRERPDDVPALFRHFAQEFAAGDATGVLQLTAGALECLRRHAWPGNARELRNVVEAAYLAYEGVPLEMHELPLVNNGVPMPGWCDAGQVGEEEIDRIVRALEHCQWNRSKAAELLHWSRMTLYRKMKRLSILPAGQEGDPPELS
jgi:two-component system response regulator HydG